MAKARPDLSHIAAPLRHLAVPVDSLVPDPDNARSHPDDNIDAIMRSMAEFGQDQPLVVREEGRLIIKGNGRWEAARGLGWTHVAAVLVSESEVRAAARALADNRSGELAEWDDAVLARVIERVRASDEVSTDATGFTPEDVAAVLARARSSLAAPGPGDAGGEAGAAAGATDAGAPGAARPAPASPPEEFRSYDEAIQTEHVCPRCGYSWSGNPAPGGGE
jgi:ParB/RepB/Spo0J family partition protein